MESELSERLSALEKMAELRARPREPPKARRKLRTEITTARSDLRECACAATRVGWKTVVRLVSG